MNQHPFFYQKRRKNITHASPTGWAVAAYFDYMIGTDNDLAERHIPELPRRNDTLAGRRGRRSDMCGGWTFMTRDDITRVGPLWLKYTEDVRFDDEVGWWGMGGWGRGWGNSDNGMY